MATNMGNSTLSSMRANAKVKHIYEQGLSSYITLIPEVQKLYYGRTVQLLSFDINRKIESLTTLISSLELLVTGSLLNELLELMQNKITELKNMEESLYKPFLLFVVGMGKYGKSTLVNALLNRELADVGVLPKTWKIDIFEKSTQNSKDITVEIVYKDSHHKIMAESEARIYLQNEEQKREETEADALRIFNANQSKFATLEEKEQYRAYLAKKNVYQSEVKEVIWRIPSHDTILDDFRIVDTPGLTQDLLGDTKHSINDYYFKADGVIWLLDATTISSKMTQELIKNVISKTGVEGTVNNSIAVINRIDQVFSQQGDKGVEKVLTQAHNIYGNIFKKIIPFSAKKAWLGVSTNDQNAIDQSNLSSLLHHINNEFKSKAHMIQFYGKTKGIELLEEDFITEVLSYLTRLKHDTLKFKRDTQKLHQEAADLEKIQKNEVYRSLERHRRTIYARISLIKSQENIESLRDGEYIKKHIFNESEFHELTDNIIEDLKMSLEKFYRFKAGEIFFSEFHIAKRLVANELIMSNTNLDFSIGKGFADNSAVNLWSGIGLGALIGSVIPLVGTAIGAIIGGLLGFIFTQNISSRLAKLHETLQSHTDKIIEQIKPKLNELVEQNVLEVTKKLIDEQKTSFENLHTTMRFEPRVIEYLESHLYSLKFNRLKTRHIALLSVILRPNEFKN